MLGIIDLRPDLKVRQGKNFIAMELPVDQRTAPYLVSSANGLRWVPKAPQGVVQVTVRSFPDEDYTKIFREVVDEILRKSKELSWGLDFPLTSQGLSDAQDLVLWHGFEQQDCLCHPEFEWFQFIEKEWPELETSDPTYRMFEQWSASVKEGEAPSGELFGMNLVSASWLPSDLLVILPSNREFVGSVGVLFGDDVVIHVHNPVRSLAFVGGHLGSLAGSTDKVGATVLGGSP